MSLSRSRLPRPVPPRCSRSRVTGGLGCLAIAALIGLLFPAFTRYRSPAG